MKFIKYSLFALVVVSMASCLKPKNDFGGTRTDEGTIVTSITETQYLNTDAQNIGFHFGAFANFSFNTLPNESVRFFTLNVSQPREKRMSGNMTVRIEADTLPGFEPLPASALNVIQDVVIPASSASEINHPVRFTVNKTGLLDANHYGVRFRILSVSQGIVSSLDDSVDVIINPWPAYNNSRYSGRYVATTTIVDSARVYGITNNTRPFVLTEGEYTAGSFDAGNIYPTDLYMYAFGSASALALVAPNMATGAQTNIVRPVYKVDGTGKVVDVLDRLTGLSLNPVFDNSAPNSFVYTSNDQRVLSVKYTVRLTLNGLNRPFTITDRYTYDAIQAYY